MSRKMDQLTVLRLAVQHLKAIRGSLDSYTEGNYKPPMLMDKELKQLIIPSADGFLFVVDSARGRILYVSESVSQTLNFSHQVKHNHLQCKFTLNSNDILHLKAHQKMNVILIRT